MEKSQIPGVIGSLLLALGLFVPIVRVLPVSRNVNYFSYGTSGKIVLALAAISLVITFLKKYKALWVTGLLSLGLILYDLYDLQSVTSKAKLIPGYERFEPTTAGGDPVQLALLEGHTQFILKSVAFDWKGWAVMIGGVVFLIVTALLGSFSRQSETFVASINAEQ